MKRNSYWINFIGRIFCFCLLAFFSFQSNAYPAASAYYDTVQKIFIGYYQRPAAVPGLIYWANRLDQSGGNLTEIIEAFANSAESQALYGTINSSNIATVVNDIFIALFGRPVGTAGLNFYVNGFNAGQFTPATIMLNVLHGAQNEDLQSVNNKVTAANLFTRTIDPELDGMNFQATYSGSGDVTAARNFLTLYATSAKVPTQAETTAYIKANIADSSDVILGQTPEALATIGVSGGTVEITNPYSALHGAKIEIPAGALSKDTTISLRVSGTGTQTAILDIGPSGTVFSVPATVTLPYGDVTNKHSLVAFTAETGDSSQWIMIENYTIDTISNKISFNLEHLSSVIVRPLFPNISTKYYVKGKSNKLSDADNEMAKQTIRTVVNSGPWSAYYKCSGVSSVEEVYNENDANFIIEWGTPTKPTAGAETTSTGPSIGGIPWLNPKKLILNDNYATQMHLSTDTKIWGMYDFYSIVLHEVGHFLIGFGEYPTNMSDLNSVTNPDLFLDQLRRSLTANDLSRLKDRHSDCGCSSIAGNWNFTNNGTVTCTGGGESITEYPSGSGTAYITQNACNISWLVPGTSYSRNGTVNGNSIQVSGIFVIPLFGGLTITQNTYSASGIISEDTKTITLNGSGFASGSYEGTTGSCSGTDTSSFTR